MRKLLLAAAVAVACAATAAPAMAGSIAYIKDGDVWLSTDDGGRQFQVTTRGGYMDVSQADDGTMIALTGVRLHKLDRLGNVLADFDTPVSDTRPPGERVFYGPFDPAISPDGQKVAYIYYYMTQSQSPTCYPPQCVTTINEGGTGYSHSDRQTGWDENGFRKHSGWRNPAWVDNDTTILSNPTHLPNYDVVVDVPAERTGGGYMAKNWFSDTAEGNPGMGAGDITRDKKKLVYVTGENDSTLTFYSVAQFPTTFPDGESPESTRPAICYRYSGPVGGKFATPTLSPDGTRAAVAVGDGVHVVTVPDFSAGCTTDGASPKTQLLIPGAIQPDWGPADVPVSRPEPPKKPDADVKKPDVKAPGGDQPQAGAPALAITRAKLRKALAKGLAVKLTGAKPGAATLIAKLAGRVVARASGTVAADGTLSARLKFSKAARRKLRRLAKVKLAVSGGGAAAAIVLRR
jgi:hypothetical protein